MKETYQEENTNCVQFKGDFQVELQIFQTERGVIMEGFADSNILKHVIINIRIGLAYYIRNRLLLTKNLSFINVIIATTDNYSLSLITNC